MKLGARDFSKSPITILNRKWQFRSRIRIFELWAPTNSQIGSNIFEYFGELYFFRHFEFWNLELEFVFGDRKKLLISGN